MTFIAENISGACVVTMPERLVMANADTWRSHVKRVIDDGNHRLILDLADVEFVDSSGLSVLVFALKCVRAIDGEAVLLNPSQNVLSLIELTRLHEVFEIFMDRDSAIEQMALAGELA